MSTTDQDPPSPAPKRSRRLYVRLALFACILAVFYLVWSSVKDAELRATTESNCHTSWEEGNCFAITCHGDCVFDQTLLAKLVEQESPNMLDRTTGQGYIGRPPNISFAAPDKADTKIRVTWSGWRYLDHLQLTYFGIHAPVDRDFVRHVASLRSLETVSLSGNSITDEMLQPLAKATQLKCLFLSNCHQVTDAGLAPLENLTQLEQLSVTNAKVTEAGMAKLRQALPHCRIQGDFNLRKPTDRDSPIH